MLKDSLKSGLLIFTGAILGTVVSLSATLVFAHGGDTSKLHACVDDTTGDVRMVGENDTCPSGETNVDWDQDAVATIKTKLPPFTCTFHCDFSEISARFKGKDFSYAAVTQFDFINVDMSGTIFSHANMNSEFTDSDMSDTKFDNVTASLEANNADFTNADFTNAFIRGTMTTANLQNVDFTNAKLYVDFTGATNMGTATLTGVTWVDNTLGEFAVCPDGTNSTDHSDTCIGHLTP